MNDDDTSGDQLAARTFTPLAGAEQQQAGPDAGPPPAPEENPLLQRMEQIGAALVFGLLKALRGRLAIKLPELRDEWPDALLQAPAMAAGPVLRKRAGALLAMADGHEEEALLAMACLPLAFGYFAAMDKHASTIDGQARPVEEPAPPAPAE